MEGRIEAAQSQQSSNEKLLCRFIKLYIMIVRSAFKPTVLLLGLILFGSSPSLAQFGGWDSPGDLGPWEEEGSSSFGWTEPPPSETSETGEADFPSSILESPETLIEEGGSFEYSPASSPAPTVAPFSIAPGGGQNAFWIVSEDGTRYWRAVNIPVYHYARLLIIPSSSGSLMVEKRTPAGLVETRYLGNVWAHNQYRTWFYADAPGIHQLRYRIGNGPYSDVLTFYVGAAVPVPPPAPDGRPNIQIVTQAVDPQTNRVYYSYNPQGLQIFRIKVLVTGPDLYRIRSVHYQLHPTFSPSEQTMTNPRDNFELELWTWGAFNMPITVTMTDGRAYRYDYPFTFGDQLRDAQRRGVPFVRVW